MDAASVDKKGPNEEPSTTTKAPTTNMENSSLETDDRERSVPPINGRKMGVLSRSQSKDGGEPIVNKPSGIITVRGTLVDLWDCEEHKNNEAPRYPFGAGFTYEEYKNRGWTTPAYVPARPYLKEHPSKSLQLESFDLRIIYEGGRTGFEASKEFPIIINSVIAGRYQVLQYIDSAAFSRAVRCLDLKHNLEVCIKIIRNSKDFFDQALDEIKLLQYINCKGDPDENCILQLFDYFYYKEHVFIVTELLRDNLYEFSKFNREQELDFYFTMARVKAIAKQVLKALSFISTQCHLLHADLKPENILIKSYSRCEVKVIDFGSSCFEVDSLSSYIQSRYYRAPEVILGCHYDGRIDVWSLGAILCEILTGNVLFYSESIPAMLARIAAVCGPFPERLLHEGRHTCCYVTTNGVFYEKVRSGDLFYHFPIPEPLLKMKFPSANDHFMDFISQCLTIDYKERPTATELLEHPFIQADYGSAFSAPPLTSKKSLHSYSRE